MKKFCIIFLSSIIIILTAIGFGGCLNGETAGTAGTVSGVGGVQSEYLRIHIRADSNEAEAQAVKYLVRDSVVEYLTPVVAKSKTKLEALKNVNGAILDIKRVADDVLQKNGYDYGAKAKITTESFPTRVYGEYTLPSGEYTALIIELGRAQGDNWWCVVYPPLCFTGATDENVVYKSKILEIIQAWKDRL